MIIYRIYYTKRNFLKFISHLDMINLIQRAIFSTDLKVEYSKGFNPHPLMSFANPLPLGVSSDMEVFDIRLEEEMDIDKTKEELNNFLPKDVQITNIYLLEERSGINDIYKYSIYEFTIYTEEELNKIEIDLNSFIQTRYKKQKRRKEKIEIQEEISDFILDYSQFTKTDDGAYSLVATLQTNQDKTINPIRFIESLFSKYNLNIQIENVLIHKKAMING